MGSFLRAGVQREAGTKHEGSGIGNQCSLHRISMRIMLRSSDAILVPQRMHLVGAVEAAPERRTHCARLGSRPKRAIFADLIPNRNAQRGRRALT
jgi:hypothetical protein